MYYFIPVLLCHTLSGVLAVNPQADVESCQITFTHFNDTEVAVRNDCTKKPCLAKCCGEDEILTSRPPVCTKSEKSTSLDWDVYKSDNTTILTTKNLADFHLVHIKGIMKPNCSIVKLQGKFEKKIENITVVKSLNLLEDGSQVQIENNVVTNTFTPLSFCVERFLKKDKLINIILIMKNPPIRRDVGLENSVLFLGIALLISAFFFLLLLWVYCVLAQLRNIGGMMLMAYSCMMIITNVLQGSIYLFYTVLGAYCKYIKPIFYFSLLSCFFWLNTMSFDIWWTFRGMRLKQSIHRQGEIVKFLWYGLYAWGVPAAVTVAALIINSHGAPHLVKPPFDTCDNSPEPVKLYINTPIIILIVINLVLFSLTVYNMWCISRMLANFNNSSSNTKNRNRFFLYLKMSMLMGVSWVLDQAHSVFDKSWILNIFLDLFNALIGFFIFIMFVCNKSTFIMLCKRFNIRSRHAMKWEQNSSTRTTTSRPSVRTSKTKTTDASELDTIGLETASV